MGKNVLGCPGGVDPQILDAILVLAGIEDLSGVYANGFPDAGIIRNRARHDLFRH
jgi:hypothetical protein